MPNQTLAGKKISSGFGVIATIMLLNHQVDIIALPWPTTPGLWELPSYKLDRRKLENYPLYLAESTGALSVLLGESEEQLRLKHGAPDFRNYASPETLRYQWSQYDGNIKLRNGRIISIKIDFHSDAKRPTPWLTALGLHEEDLLNLTREQKTEVIRRHYSTHYQMILNNRIEIFGRGISFYFTGDTITSIEIYPARKYP